MFPDDVLKKLRRNRNPDSCERNATGAEKTGIRRIPAGIGNLVVPGHTPRPLAIHLILLSIHKVSPNTIRSVHIYSDCLGALDKVKKLPPHRIPTRCCHSDVLKNIMVHCSSMSFDRIFSDVSAHQDDRVAFNNLSRHAQLNWMVDYGAKHVHLNLSPDELPWQQAFPLETVSV